MYKSELLHFGAAIEVRSGGGTTKLICEHVGAEKYVIKEVTCSGGTNVYDPITESIRQIEVENLGEDGVAIYPGETAIVDPSTSTSMELGIHRIDFVINDKLNITFNKKTIPLTTRPLPTVRYAYLN